MWTKIELVAMHIMPVARECFIQTAANYRGVRTNPLITTETVLFFYENSSLEGFMCY